MFIVIEGLDGAGKSEVSQRLAQSTDSLIYRTPSDEYKVLREAVDSSGNRYAQFYYYISSVFYASSKIQELVNQGKSVICDRYYYSTLSYFSDLPESESINTSKFFQPDFSFFLNVADESVREERVLGRSSPGWAELLCSNNEERLRILSNYQKFDLIVIETSNSSIIEVADKIKNYISI